MAYVPAYPNVDRHYYKLMTAVILLIVGLLVAALSMTAEHARDLLSEGGIVETLTAAAYLISVATFFREGGWDFCLRHFYFPLVPLLLCMRELDFHNAFTAMSMTKSRFYVSPDVPILQKLIAVIIILALIAGVVLMIRRHGRDFLEGLRDFDATAVAVALAFACAGGAKTLDGLGRKLAEFGIQIGADAETAALAFEEILELGIPLFIAIAVFSYFSRDDEMRFRG